MPSKDKSQKSPEVKNSSTSNPTSLLALQTLFKREHPLLMRRPNNSLLSNLAKMSGKVLPSGPPAAEETAKEAQTSTDTTISEEILSQLTPWNVANYTVTAATTSAAIVSLTSPARSMSLNLIKENAFLGQNRDPGCKGVINFLYRGATISFRGSCIKSGYVTVYRDLEPIAVGRAPKEHAGIAKQAYSVAAGFGETFVTNYHDTLAGLNKLGKIGKEFSSTTPHNAFKLWTNGFKTKLVSSSMYASFLMQVEPLIAEKLFFKKIENRTVAHILTGSCTGVAAAIMTFPVTAFKDSLLVNTKVNDKGLLENENGLHAIKKLITQVKENPNQSMSKINVLFWKTMPLRTLSTAVVFSAMAGVKECLGKEPLSQPYKMLGK